MAEKLESGTIPISYRPSFLVTNSYVMFFTDQRIIVVEYFDQKKMMAASRTITTKALSGQLNTTLKQLQDDRTKELMSKTPDEIAVSFNGSFVISSADIKEVTYHKGGMLTSSINVTTNSKKYGFRVYTALSDKSDDEYIALLKSVFNDKFAVK